MSAPRTIRGRVAIAGIGETAYYTEFLLGHMKKVKTVLSVVSPRDFEQCSGPKDGFFSATLANAYVFDGLSPFPIYLTHPAGRFPQAGIANQGHADVPGLLLHDDDGQIR